MKSHLMTEDIVDIAAYPVPGPAFSNYDDCVFGTRQITLPDLHGNGLKNLWTLIYYGIFQLDPVTYQHFVYLYYTPIELWGKDEIDILKQIFNRITINEKAINNVFVRFMGDDNGDRGLLDFINFLIYAKLHHGRINFVVLVSNHGMELVLCLELRNDFNMIELEDLKHIRSGVEVPGLPPHFRISLTNMQTLIDSGAITKEEVYQIINECYLPHLIVVDYSINKITLRPTVYTHAGAGDNSLVALDKQMNELLSTFGLSANDITQLKSLDPTYPFNFKVTRDRALFIDHLNIKFEIIKKEKQIHKLYIEGSAFSELVWNRKQGHLIRDPDCDYCNGHHKREMHEPKKKNVFEIDCDIGKSTIDNQGVYLLLNSYDYTSKEYNDAFDNNHLDAIKIAYLNQIEFVKQEIIKSLSDNQFVNVIKDVDNNNTGSISQIDFIKCAFDERFIFSHYQINNLKYLLVKNKEAFENLFKDDTTNTFNVEAIQYLISTIKNNQLHSLLNIISHLLKHDDYAEKRKLIFNRVLKCGHECKYFMPYFDRFLLIMNEVSKAVTIDVDDILQFLSNDQYQLSLSSNIQNCHENLAGFYLDYFVDYTKLNKVFQGAEYSKVCWMVKVLGLTYIACGKEQHKENMHLLINSHFDKLINAMIYLKQWKTQTQLQHGQIDHGAMIIENIKKMIQFLPHSFLASITRYLIKLPHTFVNLHFYGRYIYELIINVKEGPIVNANRYDALIDILASKFNVGIEMKSYVLKMLLSAQSNEFHSALKLMRGLTHEANGLSQEDRILLAKLIFTNHINMQLFIMIGVRFQANDQFSKEDVLDLLEHVERSFNTFSSEEMRNAFANVLNQMIPTLNVRVSAALFFVSLTLVDTLYRNRLLEKFGLPMLSFLASKECLNYILQKQSLSNDELHVILQHYFIKTLQLPIKFVGPNQSISNDAIEQTGATMPPPLSQSPHATFKAANDNKINGDEEKNKITNETKQGPYPGEKRKK